MSAGIRSLEEKPREGPSAGEQSEMNGPSKGGFTNLPIELLKTERGAYAFDARKVFFLELSPTAFDILRLLREKPLTLQQICRALPQHRRVDLRRAHRAILEMRADDLLVAGPFRRLQRHPTSELRQFLREKVAGITILITTQCNLACSYCIYGGQYELHPKLAQRPMSWRTLRATLDFLERHSRKSEQLTLNFFGGEPLLAFPLIERGVRYMKSLVRDSGRRVVVTVTSNGTVLNPRILEFLLEHDVHLQFSIDGGKDSHDLNRIFKVDGRGSHAVILRNLQTIHDWNPDYFRNNMWLKGVLASDSDRDADEAFFNHPLIRKLIERHHYVMVEVEPHYDLEDDSEYFARLERLARRLLEPENVKSEPELLAGLSVKERALYYHSFAEFFEVQAVNEVHFSGCDATPFRKGCVPGYQEGAVHANGDVSICLKASRGANFVIGNVHGGEWYYDKIEALNDRLQEGSQECSSCFLQKICTLCFEKLDGEPGRWLEGRRNFCRFNRERYRFIFGVMLKVLERSPELWKFLESVIAERLEDGESSYVPSLFSEADGGQTIQPVGSERGRNANQSEREESESRRTA